jgi:hypothetical protein
MITKKNDKVMFNRDDVVRILELENSSCNYDYEDHYKIYINENTFSVYFTYTGLVRAIYMASSDFATYLQQWLSNVIFYTFAGTDSQITK